MSTRSPESTHEAEPNRSQAKAVPVESPSADAMTGSNGPLHQPEPDDNPAGDQDIDTAGTDADDQSPTRAMGTGMAPNRPKG